MRDSVSDLHHCLLFRFRLANPHIAGHRPCCSCTDEILHGLIVDGSCVYRSILCLCICECIFFVSKTVVLFIMWYVPKKFFWPLFDLYNSSILKKLHILWQKGVEWEILNHPLKKFHGFSLEKEMWEMLNLWNSY